MSNVSRRTISADIIVLAHRGYHAFYPENSMAALCAASGVADGFETDVRMTADGVLVLSHDPDAPNGAPIASMAYSELNSAFKPRGGLVIFDELLNAVDSNKFAFIEIKVPGISDRVRRLASPIFGSRLRIGSFDPGHLVGVPFDMRWLIVHGADEVPAALTRFSGIAPRADAYPFGLDIHERAAWKVEVADVSTLLIDGVSFLITDDPLSVRATINKMRSI